MTHASNPQSGNQASTPSASAPRSHEEIDIRRLFGILVDHKRWVLASVVAFALLGLIYVSVATPIYRADALVQIESASPGNNPLKEVSTLLGQEPPTLSEIEIIQSRMVLGRAVDLLNLDISVAPVTLPVIGSLLERQGVSRPGFAAGWRYAFSGESIAVSEMPVSQAYEGQPFRLRVLNSYRYRLFDADGNDLGEGKLGELSNFAHGGVALRVTSIDAAAGATFELRHGSRLAAINALRGRLAVAEAGSETGILSWSLTGTDPQETEKTLNTIADIYYSQNVQRQSEEARKSLEFLDGQVPKIRAQVDRAEEKLNRYRESQDSVDLSLETKSVLDRLVNLEAQLNELEMNEAEIAQRFTKSHPTYQALLEKKAQLQRERANLDQQIKGMPKTQQEILRLKRDAEVNNEIYVQLLNKVQETRIAEASTVGNVRVLDSAQVQATPVAPNKPLLLAVAVIVGLIVGVAGVFLRALFHRGIETQEQIEETGLAVYATVPLSDEQRKLNRRERRDRRGSRRDPRHPQGLLSLRNPADVSVEALRGLRTSLHFAMLEANDNRLMITGPSPGVGKSFVSVNLAAVCAQAGQRVLVVDADMRKGQVHNVFGATSESGLSDVLGGRLTLDEVIRGVGECEGLAYVARGTAPPNPSELLMGPRFSAFLATVSERFDLVIVDSPPILAVTDAAIIGKQVGTSLMLVRFERNPVKELELAIGRLRTAGVEPRGAILNAVERKAATAYGYGYYHYNYQ
ncbi:polysaccharide biosynthesis tyrosine autokinase [Salinicola endophyticus]|uniref:Polysaccharide biosynthesis tyrosine autokinase n=1 Tax=Salinicola endophyticus TaxID=1949083 RepID=A0ABY8FP85_9GAMM|nr:polysaccharide biosynthesis tyrosine autokinase [Salinicola endophyticus]WFF43011.1 polysaccharide biosynthesis tyrosine autokinase [Salinicola endophyticus]